MQEIWTPVSKDLVNQIFVDYRDTDVRDMALKHVFIKKYPYQM